MNRARSALFAALFLVAIIAAAFVFKNLETTSRTHKSYAEAMASEPPGGSGWLPAWLPTSAYDIQEAHNIDTNESWLIFRFSANSFERSMCKEIRKTEVELPDEQAVRKFPSFVERARAQVQGLPALKYYACDREAGRYLAVDEEANVAYSWTLPR